MIEASQVSRTGWIFTVLFMIPLELAAAGLYINGFGGKSLGFRIGMLLLLSGVCTAASLLLGKALFTFLYGRIFQRTENRTRSRKIAAAAETVILAVMLIFMLILYKLN